MCISKVAQIVKEIVDSGKFLRVYLIGDAAADIYIAHNGRDALDDQDRVYGLEISTGCDENDEEAQRVASILKDILRNHKCVFPQRAMSLFNAQIDGLRFDIFANVTSNETIQIIDGMPVVDIDSLIKGYTYVTKDLELEISLLTERLDMCKTRMALLSS